MTRGPEAEGRGPSWQVQAAFVARRFYLDGRTKVEIAEELGLSRFKVARILDEAREFGLVEVHVQLPAPIDPELSTALQERLGLRRAVAVLPPEGTPGAVRQEIGRVAADLLSEVVTPADVLGLTCSRTVATTTQALGSLAPCPVVQLSGTLAGPDLEAGSVESVRRAAVVGGGKAFPVYAPMVLPDPATRRGLAAESAISQAMAQYEAVTVALVSVGAWEREMSTVWQAVAATERRAATRAGAVGEIGARIFDADGTPVRTPLDERVLGVTLERLRAVQEVIGVASDARRATAVRAAIRGGLVDSLVCDTELAARLLEMVPARPRGRGATA